MKRCVHCGEFKDESEFAWRWKSMGIRQKHCRACMSKFNKASYDKKGEDGRRQIYNSRDRRGQEAKQFVWEYLASQRQGCREGQLLCRNLPLKFSKNIRR